MGNTISNAGFDAIFAKVQNTTSATGMNLTIAGNTITSPHGAGFDTQVDNSAQVLANVSGNTFNNIVIGAFFNVGDTASVTATVNNNLITGTGDSGGVVGNVISSGVLNLTANGNVISGVGTGISGASFDGASLTMSINQNALSNISGSGIDARQSGSSTLSVNPSPTTLINNTVIGTSSWMTNTGAPSGSIIINGNTYTLPANAP
jgi:hypothetical protein